MRKYFAVLLSSLALTGCLQKQFENLDKKDPTEESKDPTEGTIFDFSTKGDFELRIIAISGSGKKCAKIPFYIYGSDPYNKEGEWRGVSPLYVGVTLEDGVLEAALTVPKTVKTLYIIPGTSGFGSMQTYEVANGTTTLEFKGKAPAYLPNTKSLQTKSESFVSIPVHPEFKMNLYTFYEGATGTYNGQPAYTNKGEDATSKPTANISLTEDGAPFVNYKGIVSYVEDTYIGKLANAMYPETGLGFKKDPSLLKESKNTDLIVKGSAGAEVWATYLSDGDFHKGAGNANESFNMLCYYHYTGDTPPSNVRKTVLFPNTNPNDIATGVRVQLLYWDGTKYVKTFPDNTRIGWCMIQNAYGTAGNDPNKPKRFSHIRIKNKSSYRHSHAALNRGITPNPYNQAVARWVESFDCSIVGVENKPALTSGSDDDFNDVLFYVTSNPIAVKPDIDIDDHITLPGGGGTSGGSETPGTIPGEGTLVSSQIGTLAFEDSHPTKGDYDHNDFVADYNYEIVKNFNGEVTRLDFTLEPRSVGATRDIGFGIEIPQLDQNEVGSASGARLEPDTKKPSIIIWDDVRAPFGKSGYKKQFNTLFPEKHITGTTTKASVILRTPLSASRSNKLTVRAFNPFIFVDNRDNETHLPNYRPTSKGNTNKFGTADDKSDGVNTFYRTGSGYAWALDLAIADNLSPTWAYPLELIPIDKAYPGYSDWVKGDYQKDNWSNFSEGVNTLLYIYPVVEEDEEDKEE